ncbi:hypothetical protein ABW19_dt0209994 [Dactylella cylindrospora]|nr:hypothetical protein ABW19_dt0209994 [Dactylella cylindrospora]
MLCKSSLLHPGNFPIPDWPSTFRFSPLLSAGPLHLAISSSRVLISHFFIAVIPQNPCYCIDSCILPLYKVGRHTIHNNPPFFFLLLSYIHYSKPHPLQPPTYPLRSLISLYNQQAFRSSSKQFNTLNRNLYPSE